MVAHSRVAEPATGSATGWATAQRDHRTRHPASERSSSSPVWSCGSIVFRSGRRTGEGQKRGSPDIRLARGLIRNYWRVLGRAYLHPHHRQRGASPPARSSRRAHAPLPPPSNGHAPSYPERDTRSRFWWGLRSRGGLPERWGGRAAGDGGGLREPERKGSETTGRVTSGRATRRAAREREAASGTGTEREGDGMRLRRARAGAVLSCGNVPS